MVWRIIFALSIFITTSSAFAGFDEGVTAYKAGDYATAMKEWLPLAKKGNPDAQRNLGIMYQYGEGAKIDLKKAVDWYTKAANQGESSSQATLGDMYLNGVGIKKDVAKALDLFRKSAKQGDANAEANLGDMYKSGVGVKNDRLRQLIGIARQLSKTMVVLR